MSVSRSDIDAIKRKIRKLKKAEMKIRFGQCGLACSPDMRGRSGLVWDLFFDLDENGRRQARYTASQLAAMDKDTLTDVISDFFWQVYYRLYQENGIMDTHLYDPDVLARLGLPPDADARAVKKRFRELAKRYHPDAGGDSARFIDMIDTFSQLEQRTPSAPHRDPGKQPR